MRILRGRIYGFGVLPEQELPELSSGLSIFVGDNEAGKSTCLDFFRVMLTGYPTRKGVHTPLHGGSGGGTLQLMTQMADHVTLQRMQGTKGGTFSLADAEGKRLDSLAPQLFGGVTRELYRNVYGFSLTELQTFESLDNEGIRNALYGASFGLGLRPVGEVLSKFQKKAGDIFAKRSQKPFINEHLKKLRELQSKIKSKGSNAELYTTLSDKLSVLEKHLDNLRQEKQSNDKVLQRAQKYAQAWPVWHELMRLEAELQQIETAVDNFPENGLARFEDLLERRDEAVEQKEAVGQKVATQEIELATIQDAPAFIEALPELNALSESKGAYRNAKEALPKAHADSHYQNDALAQKLASLGTGWTMEKVHAFDLSIATEDVIDATDEKLNAQKAEVRSTQKVVEDKVHDYAEAKSFADEVKVEVERLENALVLPREISIESCTKNVQALEKNIEQRKSLEAQLAERITEEQDYLEKIAECKKQQDADTIKFKDLAAQEQNKQERISFVLCTVFMACIWITTSILGNIIPLESADIRNIMLSLCIMAGVVSILVTLFMARQKPQKLEAITAKLDDAIPSVDRAYSPLDVWNSQVQSVKAQHDILREKLHQLKEQETVLYQELQMLVSASEDGSIESFYHEAFSALQNAKAAEEAYLQAERLAQDKESQCQRAKERLDSATASHVTAQKTDNTLQKAWQEWLMDRGLEKTLTPDGVRKILHCMKLCLDFEMAIKLKKDEMIRHERTCSTLQDAVTGWCTKLGVQPCVSVHSGLQEMDTLATLDSLVHRAEEAQKQAQEKAHLSTTLSTSKQEYAAACRALDTVTEKIVALLQEGGALADDGQATSHRQQEELFRHRARCHKERSELLAQITAQRIILKGLMPVEEDFIQFCEAFKDQNLESLAQQVDKLSLEQSAYQEQEADLVDEMGALRAKIEHVQDSTEVATLRQEEAALLEEIQSSAHSWVKYTLAQYFLETAKKQFEAERQPEIIRLASNLFRTISGGTWQGIVATLEDELNVVPSEEHGLVYNTVAPAMLSRGTQEQLYLALRLAYIQNHAVHAEPLPIIMDDIMVNFDKNRAQKTADVLAQVAKDHQILFFTCHEHTASMLAQSVDDAKCFRMDKGRIETCHEAICSA
ncbi:MAG: AAA family ATPase [Pseudomonadota bacterium]